MTNVIYLPGLGDNTAAQAKILKFWKILGLNIEVIPMNWSDTENFDNKLKRILQRIDQLTQDGSRVSLIGVSAGASAALNAYVAAPEKINKVLFICGKLKGAERVGQHYYTNNPAFKDSLFKAEAQINKLGRADKAKMLSAHPVYDNIVPIRDTKIPGVADKTMLSFGHIIGITLALTIYFPSLARFLRS